MNYDPATDPQQAHREQQARARRREAEGLMLRARTFLKKARHPQAKRRAESDARKALAAYRGSLDWAEDTELEGDAHRVLDEAGKWVRQTFGCHLERDGQAYRQTCPVALGHNRIGLSIGGRATVRVCSLCGQDASECEHLPDTKYLVPGGAEELGWCRVCLQEHCDHIVTETYEASLVSIIREMDLAEVSIVGKPAHPEARIHAVSISVSELKESLGDEFEPGMDVSCDRCLTPCGGLIRHQFPHGRFKR